MFAFLYYFVAVVYQISHAVELPENDKDGCFRKLIHLKTQVHSTQVFLENLFSRFSGMLFMDLMDFVCVTSVFRVGPVLQVFSYVPCVI